MKMNLADILSSPFQTSPSHQASFVAYLLGPLIVLFLLRRLFASSLLLLAPSRSSSPVDVHHDDEVDYYDDDDESSSQPAATACSKVVVITGADTGFGLIATLRLVEQLGYCVFAGCLDAEKAAKSLEYSDLKQRYPNTFHIVQMDVTNDSQVHSAMTAVSNWLNINPTYHLLAIVNNAGITYPMVPIELCSMESFSNVLNINVYGALRVIKAFVPLLRLSSDKNSKYGGGRVVVMSSLACELSCPMMSAYCASKWALTAVCDTLRYELHRFGIFVSIVLPDLYKTQLVLNKEMLHASLDRELAKMEQKTLELYGGDVCIARMRRFIEMMDAFANPNLAPVVDAMCEAISAKRPSRRYYPITWKSQIVITLSRWFPSLLDTMVNVGQVV